MKGSILGMPNLLGKALFTAKNRLTALFFVALIIFGAAAPVAQTYAATHSTGPSQSDITGHDNNNNNSHKTSTAPSVGTINNSTVPAPQASSKSSLQAATDAAPAPNNTSANILNVWRARHLGWR